MPTCVGMTVSADRWVNHFVGWYYGYAMQGSAYHSARSTAGTASPVIVAYGPVRLTRDVRTDGHRIPKDAPGTVVGRCRSGTAYAVEIANLPGGPDVETLQADRIASGR